VATPDPVPTTGLMRTPALGLEHYGRPRGDIACPRGFGARALKPETNPIPESCLRFREGCFSRGLYRSPFPLGGLVVYEISGARRIEAP
jgi:hypothetical protein